LPAFSETVTCPTPAEFPKFKRKGKNDAFRHPQKVELDQPNGRIRMPNEPGSVGFGLAGGEVLAEVGVGEVLPAGGVPFLPQGATEACPGTDPIPLPSFRIRSILGLCFASRHTDSQFAPDRVDAFVAWLRGMPGRGFLGRPANWPA
jgi:hypothetical protein